MPLYEFYCEPCHALFTFRAQRVDTTARPPCPQCGAELKREVSLFSHTVRSGGDTGEVDLGGSDSDERMERALAAMAGRIQDVDLEDGDPREAARVMRAIAAEGGLAFNAEVREALDRIESGEDPDKIDEEFSEVFESENPFEEMGEIEGGRGSRISDLWRRMRPPKRVTEWFELDMQ